MYIILIYFVAIMVLYTSFKKDINKTKKILCKTKKNLNELFPQIIIFIMILGIILSLLDSSTISRYLGDSSGISGLFLAMCLGSIVIMPTMVAFPLAAKLFQMGAGYMHITTFLTTLTMVGIISLPIEKQIMGRRATVIRNTLALILAIIEGVVLEIIMH